MKKREDMKECNDDCCPIVFDDGTTPDDMPTILYCYDFADGEGYKLYNMALAYADIKALEAIHGKCTQRIERKG